MGVSSAMRQVNHITGTIISGAMTVHSVLGPGLLESAYHACLVHELTKRGLAVASNLQLPIVYDGVVLDIGYRIDLLVEGQVIVELKAVERIHPVHQAQVLSYMKLQGCRVGLLINFNVVRLKDGITRLLNGY